MKALFFCASALFFLCNSNAYARTNEPEVRSEIEKKHDKVVWGKRLDKVEYMKFAAGLAESPAAVAAYMELLAIEITKQTGAEIATDTLFDLISGKGSSTIVGGNPVYVGIATYNIWTEEGGPMFEVKVQHPNEHQFYIAIGHRSEADNTPEHRSFVLMSNSKTGELVINRFAEDGNKEKPYLHEIITGWQGWEGVAGYTIGGQTYVMFIQPERGELVIDKILQNADKAVKHSFKVDQGWTGWHGVGAYTVNQKTFVMFINPTSGEIVINQILSNGNISNAHSFHHKRIWKGWYGVGAYSVNGKSYVMFIKPSTGELRVDEILQDGNKANDHSHHHKRGWSGFVGFGAYDVAGKSYVMLGNPTTGQLFIDEILADGNKAQKNLHMHGRVWKDWDKEDGLFGDAKTPSCIHRRGWKDWNKGITFTLNP